MDDFTVAVLLSVASLVQLGCWLAAWKHLHVLNRNPTHMFIDYGIGLIFMGCLPTLLTGWTPDVLDGKPSFFDQIQQPIMPLVAIVLAAGVLLGVADNFMTITVKMIGLSLGPAISSSTSLALTIVANYLLDSGLNDARLVFPGMAVAITAVVVGAITQSRYARYDAHHGLEEHDTPEVIITHLSVPEALEHAAAAATAGTSSSSESEAGHAEAAHASAAGDLEQPLLVKVHQPPPLTRAQLKKNTIIGLLSATTGGVLVALFVPAVNIACNDQFHLLPPGVQPLSIWTANFFINLALAITCIGMGVVMLYWPQMGGARSSLKAWFFDNNGRPLALLSGVLNASGNMFQYMAGQRAGFAAAALSQTFPVVTTVIGLVAFREFRGASRGTAALLALQVALYLGSATILAASFKPRSE